MHLRDRGHAFYARLLVWLALSAALLGYIGWGRETTSITSFFFIRRSVRDIWGYFYEGLPDIGNARALDTVYWVSIGVALVGVLALIWLALEPEPPEPDAEAFEV
jgi:hypothetical protein